MQSSKKREMDRSSESEGMPLLKEKSSGSGHKPIYKQKSSMSESSINQERIRKIVKESESSEKESFSSKFISKGQIDDRRLKELEYIKFEFDKSIDKVKKENDQKILDVQRYYETIVKDMSDKHEQDYKSLDDKYEKDKLNLKATCKDFFDLLDGRISDVEKSIEDISTIETSSRISNGRVIDQGRNVQVDISDDDDIEISNRNIFESVSGPLSGNLIMPISGNIHGLNDMGINDDVCHKAIYETKTGVRIKEKINDLRVPEKKRNVLHGFFTRVSRARDPYSLGVALSKTEEFESDDVKWKRGIMYYTWGTSETYNLPRQLREEIVINHPKFLFK